MFHHRRLAPSFRTARWRCYIDAAWMIAPPKRQARKASHPRSKAVSMSKSILLKILVTRPPSFRMIPDLAHKDSIATLLAKDSFLISENKCKES